jgi:hypothetical protein
MTRTRRQLRLEEEVNYPTLAREARMGHHPSRIPLPRDYCCTMDLRSGFTT